MKHQEMDNFKDILYDATQTWLDRAIKQKNPRLTVSLAYSEPYYFHQWDIVILNLKGGNQG